MPALRAHRTWSCPIGAGTIVAGIVIGVEVDPAELVQRAGGQSTAKPGVACGITSRCPRHVKPPPTIDPTPPALDFGLLLQPRPRSCSRPRAGLPGIRIIEHPTDRLHELDAMAPSAARARTTRTWHGLGAARLQIQRRLLPGRGRRNWTACRSCRRAMRFAKTIPKGLRMHALPLRRWSALIGAGTGGAANQGRSKRADSRLEIHRLRPDLRKGATGTRSRGCKSGCKSGCRT